MKQFVPQEREIALVNVAVHRCTEGARHVDWCEGVGTIGWIPVKKTTVRCIEHSLQQITGRVNANVRGLPLRLG
jgi:hypothetical protein